MTLVLTVIVYLIFLLSLSLLKAYFVNIDWFEFPLFLISGFKLLVDVLILLILLGIVLNIKGEGEGDEEGIAWIDVGI